MCVRNGANGCDFRVKINDNGVEIGNYMCHVADGVKIEEN